MELMKDYDCTIDYHPGKANVVADSLSRKSDEWATGMITYRLNSVVSLWAMDVSITEENGVLLATMNTRPQLLEDIKQAQLTDYI